MKEQLTLKYACMDQFDNIFTSCDNPIISEYLISLKNLIVYQMDIIKEQRITIISYKHHNAWKQYDNK